MAGGGVALIGTTLVPLLKMATSYISVPRDLTKVSIRRLKEKTKSGLYDSSRLAKVIRRMTLKNESVARESRSEQMRQPRRDGVDRRGILIC